jgi:hypothetical protein
VAAVADTLSRLDIDSLKIQEEIEELLTLLSGSENNSIINIRLTIPMHTALIFKEQARVKEPGLREKVLANLITQYSMLKGIIFFATKKRSISQSLRQIIKSNVLVSRIFTSSGTD